MCDQNSARRRLPPKLPRIRQTGLFQGEIHTGLIWENVRSEFGPAQLSSEKARGASNCGGVAGAFNVIGLGAAVGPDDRGIHGHCGGNAEFGFRDRVGYGGRSPGGWLGVRVWVALSFVPDWRWLLDSSDSPWYPSMKLIRQRRAGDWEGVFERMEQELEGVVLGAADDFKTETCGRAVVHLARTRAAGG